MSKNYYEEQLEKIIKLIKKEEYKIAYDLIEDELKMPYIPEIYEVKFIDLLNNVKSELLNDNISHSVPKDVALDYLTSEDEQKEAMALELLRDHNLRPEKELFKRRIETWAPEKNMMKAFLFELLIEQEVDIEISFNGMNINPSRVGSVLSNKKVIEINKILETKFQKDPAKLNIALDEFQKFLLLTYPIIPEDPKQFSSDLEMIVNSLFDEDIQLTQRQKIIKKALIK